MLRPVPERLNRARRHSASGVPRQEYKLRFSRLRNPLRHDLTKAPHRDQDSPPVYGTVVENLLARRYLGKFSITPNPVIEGKKQGF